MSNQSEEAMTLCQLGNMLLKGSEARGENPFSVNLHISCPRGKAIGIHHTHPGGEPEPSAQDIAEAKRFSLDWLCVTVPETRVTKCYPVK